LFFLTHRPVLGKSELPDTTNDGYLQVSRAKKGPHNADWTTDAVLCVESSAGLGKKDYQPAVLRGGIFVFV